MWLIHYGKTLRFARTRNMPRASLDDDDDDDDDDHDDDDDDDGDDGDDDDFDIFWKPYKKPQWLYG